MRGAEAFLVTFAFIGAVLGTAVGALSAWRDWPPVRAFGLVLALFLIAALVPDFHQFDVHALVGTFLIAPLVSVLSTGAGFIVGRRFVARISGKADEKTP